MTGVWNGHVAEADQHAILALEVAVDGWLNRGIGEVGAGVGRILHFAEHQFRINLAGNDGDFELAELQIAEPDPAWDRTLRATSAVSRGAR